MAFTRDQYELIKTIIIKILDDSTGPSWTKKNINDVAEEVVKTLVQKSIDEALLRR